MLTRTVKINEKLGYTVEKKHNERIFSKFNEKPVKKEYGRLKTHVFMYKTI